MDKAEDIYSKYFTKAGDAPTEVTIEDTHIENSLPNKISYRADGNVDLNGFTTLFKNLLDDTWEENWGTFAHGEPKSAKPEDITFPMIVFDTLSRKPWKSLKYREYEIEIDPQDSNYTLIVSRKRFMCNCAFIIAHNNNSEAYELMTRLEAFIDTYTGYFKKNGVAEIVFDEEIKYKPESKALSDKAIKCICYKIVIERIHAERVRTTKAILSQIDATANVQSNGQ